MSFEELTCMFFQQKPTLMIFWWAHIFSLLTANLMKTNKQKAQVDTSRRLCEKGQRGERDVHVLHQKWAGFPWGVNLASSVRINGAMRRRAHPGRIQTLWMCSLIFARGGHITCIRVVDGYLLSLTPAALLFGAERIRLSAFVLLRNNNSVFLSRQLLRTMQRVITTSAGVVQELL